MGVIHRTQVAEAQLKRNLMGGMWCMRGEMELNPPGSTEHDPNEEEEDSELSGSS